MNKAGPVFWRYGACALAVAALVAVCRLVLPVNATTVSLIMLLLVLGAATVWGLSEAIFTSIAAVLAVNFYFLPPVGTFTIADPENWVALFAFLVTAFTVSQLSSQAKRRAEEAVAGQERNQHSVRAEPGDADGRGARRDPGLSREDGSDPASEPYRVSSTPPQIRSTVPLRIPGSRTPI